MLDHDAELQSGEWQNGDRHIARAHLSAGVILWTVWRRQGLVWQCASVITFSVRGQGACSAAMTALTTGAAGALAMHSPMAASACR